MSAADSAFIRREKEKAKQLRKSAWWRRKCANGVCRYCQKIFKPSELTMDHCLPLAMGGRSEKQNLIPACKECNTRKKDLGPAAWAAYLDRQKEKDAKPGLIDEPAAAHTDS
ncbi:MAG: HNH endonuclease [Leptospiraceae bacterium]|nr:HNH endonuclease [Leptospiraceae bacterium]